MMTARMPSIPSERASAQPMKARQRSARSRWPPGNCRSKMSRRRLLLESSGRVSSGRQSRVPVKARQSRSSTAQGRRPTALVRATWSVKWRADACPCPASPIGRARATIAVRSDAMSLMASVVWSFRRSGMAGSCVVVGLPGPGQQPFKLVGLGPAQYHPLKHVGQPRLRLDPVQLGLARCRASPRDPRRSCACSRHSTSTHHAVLSRRNRAQPIVACPPGSSGRRQSHPPWMAGRMTSMGGDRRTTKSVTAIDLAGLTTTRHPVKTGLRARGCRKRNGSSKIKTDELCSKGHRSWPEKGGGRLRTRL